RVAFPRKVPIVPAHASGSSPASPFSDKRRVCTPSGSVKFSGLAAFRAQCRILILTLSCIPPHTPLYGMGNTVRAMEVLDPKYVPAWPASGLPRVREAQGREAIGASPPHPRPLTL